MRLANATRLSHLRDRFAVAEFPGIVQRLAARLDLPPISVFVEPDAENANLALAVADIELITSEVLEGAKQYHPRHSPQLDIAVAGPTDGRLRLAFGCDDAGPTPRTMSRAWTPLDQARQVRRTNGRPWPRTCRSFQHWYGVWAEATAYSLGSRVRALWST